MSRLSLFALVLTGVILFVTVPALPDSSTVSNATIDSTTLLNMTSFNTTPGSIYLGQSLSFYIKVQNTGNLNITNFTVEVNTTPSGASEQRNYTGVVEPGQNVTVIIADYSPASVGSYNSTAVVYYNGTLQTNRKILNFTVLSAPTAPPSQAGVPVGWGGGGGGGGITYAVVPLPPKEKAPPGSADFVSMPIVIEPYFREIKTITFSVRNPWSEEIVNDVNVTGLPEEWLSISPRKMILKPGELKYVTVTLGIPEGALLGDYEMKILVGENDVVSLVRPKYYAPQQDQPSVSRDISVNYGTDKTTVHLSVKNGGLSTRTIEVVEDVPKSFAASARDIEFLAGVKPEIVKDDPVLLWRLIDLEPGESVTISYRFSVILKDFSVFTQWRVHQLNVIFERILARIKVIDLNVPQLFAGKESRLFFQLQNLMDNTASINVSLEMVGREAWDIKPARVEMRLGAGQASPAVFSIFTPATTFFGVQPATIKIASVDEGWEEKTALIFPVGIGFAEGIGISLSALNFAAAAIGLSIIAGSAILFWRITKRRKEMHRIHEMRLSAACSDMLHRLIIRGKKKVRHGER